MLLSVACIALSVVGLLSSRVFLTLSNTKRSTFWSSVQLTGCQVFLEICITAMGIIFHANKMGKNPGGFLEKSTVLRLIAHTLGCFSNNYALSMVFGFQAQIIRGLEPATAQILAALASDVPPEASTVLIYLVVYLAACGTFDKFYRMSVVGLTAAFMANIFFGLGQLAQESSDGKTSNIRTFIPIKWINTILCISFTIFSFLIYMTTVSKQLLVTAALCSAGSFTLFRYLGRKSREGTPQATLYVFMSILITLGLFSVEKRTFTIFNMASLFLALFLVTFATMQENLIQQRMTRGPASRDVIIDGKYLPRLLLVISIVGIGSCLGFVVVKSGTTHVNPNLQSGPQQIFGRFGGRTPQFTRKTDSKLAYPLETNRTMAGKYTANEMIFEQQKILRDIVKTVIGNATQVILTDLQDHQNKGSSAIIVGEFILLRIYLGLEILYECPAQQCDAVLIKKQFGRKQNLVIFGHGGSTFGDILPHFIPKKVEMLDVNNDKEYVLFSNTVWFNDMKAVTQARSKFNKHRDRITYLMRERKSMDFLSSYGFQSHQTILAPDPAVMIGFQSRKGSPIVNIVWNMRRDCESKFSRVNRKAIANQFGVSYIDNDWTRWKTRSKGRNMETMANLKVHLGLRFLSQGRIVITDHIHGHILSILLNIPHVILDNNYGKVFGYHETWTKNLENVMTAKNLDEAMRKALFLLKRYYTKK